jgi:hypothetical protein
MMKELVEQRRLKVAVVVVPSKEEVYSWVLDHLPPWSTSAAPGAFSAAIESLSRQMGFGFLDLKPFLLESSRSAWGQSRQLLWWRDDVHWNARGQREAAAVIRHRVLNLR